MNKVIARNVLEHIIRVFGQEDDDPIDGEEAVEFMVELAKQARKALEPAQTYEEWCNDV